MLISYNESKQVQLSQDWFGSLSNHVDNGRESAIKKRICVLSNSLLFSVVNFFNYGRFSPESNSHGLYPSSKRKRKNHRHVFTSFLKDKTCIDKFHIVALQWTSRNCTKKAWCTCSAVVLTTKTIAFWQFALPSSSSNMVNMTSCVKRSLGPPQPHITSKVIVK